MREPATNDTTEPGGHPSYLTVEEAAHKLRVDPRTVRQAIEEGTIPAKRLGRAIRIPADAI